MAHHHAVFAGQRHNVGNRANRNQIPVPVQQFLRLGLFYRANHFKGNAHTGQLFAGAFIAGQLRVDDGNGGRQFGRGQVVIGHHNIHPKVGGVGNFLPRRNAVIHRDDQRDTA
ncbi:hypothetical protein SDC9_162533 [bioreactor metagenome]|uniref:Uncharacterized protein n=1 Tax=bioreactor metagenome TaxID=1076179 RepID=A0A645FSP8_9ZZZZ